MTSHGPPLECGGGDGPRTVATTIAAGRRPDGGDVFAAEGADEALEMATRERGRRARAAGHQGYLTAAAEGGRSARGAAFYAAFEREFAPAVAAAAQALAP